MRRLSSVFLLALCAAALPLAVLGQDTPPLAVELLGGADVALRINQTTDSDPVSVRVLDATGAPVKGVAVAFQLPMKGPGGDFLRGRAPAKRFVTQTNDKGVASVKKFRANSEPGDFTVHVAASYSGHTAAVELRQRNVDLARSNADVKPGGLFGSFFIFGISVSALVSALLML
jgi:hypothetical protein